MEAQQVYEFFKAQDKHHLFFPKQRSPLPSTVAQLRKYYQLFSCEVVELNGGVWTTNVDNNPELPLKTHQNNGRSLVNWHQAKAMAEAVQKETGVRVPIEIRESRFSDEDRETYKKAIHKVLDAIRVTHNAYKDRQVVAEQLKWNPEFLRTLYDAFRSHPESSVNRHVFFGEMASCLPETFELENQSLERELVIMWFYGALKFHQKVSFELGLPELPPCTFLTRSLQKDFAKQFKISARSVLQIFYFKVGYAQGSSVPPPSVHQQQRDQQCDQQSNILLSGMPQNEVEKKELLPHSFILHLPQEDRYKWAQALLQDPTAILKVLQSVYTPQKKRKICKSA